MLSAESLKKIDREIAKYPADQKQSAVMAALVIAQDEIDRPFHHDGHRLEILHHVIRLADVAADQEPVALDPSQRAEELLHSSSVEEVQMDVGDPADPHEKLTISAV